MSAYLLDTNCISEVVRARPEARMLAWLETTDESLLHLSVLTLGEIRKGVAGLPPGNRRAQLENWLELELKARFAGRVLPVDVPVADRWGALAAEAKRRGKPLPAIDGLLAATAQHHGLTLVTRDLAGLAASGVPVFNPWKQ